MILNSVYFVQVAATLPKQNYFFFGRLFLLQSLKALPKTMNEFFFDLNRINIIRMVRIPNPPNRRDQGPPMLYSHFKIELNYALNPSLTGVQCDLVQVW